MDDAPTKECFILGSGRSLLALTRDERDHVNACTQTLAMNKFLLFHEKVGITPRDLFLADWHFPAPRVFLETLRKAKHIGARYFLDDIYRKLFFQPWLHPKWNAVVRWQWLWRHRYVAPPFVRYPHAAFFRHKVGPYEGFHWAESLDEPLFWRHGSLTTAINLATIIYPGADIKLLGVDLRGHEPFFAEELAQRDDLIDSAYRRAAEAGRHLTVVVGDEGDTMIDAMKMVRETLAERGVRLISCNAESLLVEEGVADAGAVMD